MYLLPTPYCCHPLGLYLATLVASMFCYSLWYNAGMGLISIYFIIYSPLPPFVYLNPLRLLLRQWKASQGKA